MADILITKGGGRTYVYGLSPAGTRWLQENIDHKDRTYNARVEVVVSVNADVYDDMLLELREAGLDIETR